jgi:hypothetical protein
MGAGAGAVLVPSGAIVGAIVVEETAGSSLEDGALAAGVVALLALGVDVLLAELLDAAEGSGSGECQDQATTAAMPTMRRDPETISVRRLSVVMGDAFGDFNFAALKTHRSQSH